MKKLRKIIVTLLTLVIACGFVLSGVGTKTVVQAAESAVPIYRLYNNETYEHLYTADAHEVMVLTGGTGWEYEGAGWFAPTSGTPVYRLYNTVLHNHLYTTDRNEINVLIGYNDGWVQDNNGDPLFYSAGDVPIYRLYNEALSGIHLLTTDQNEYNVLPNDGYWTQEGAAIYGVASGDPGYGILKAGAQGIDVSIYQTVRDENKNIVRYIDWNAVKTSGIEYAIIRVGIGDDETDQDDQSAIYNMTECERLGIPYGVYLYSYAVDENNAYSEIAHIKRMLNGRNPRMGVYIDVEDRSYYLDHGLDINTSEGKRTLTDLTKIVLQGITDAGYKAGFYSYVNFLQNYLYIDELRGYRWIAGYGNYEQECRDMGAVMWQYTSSGSVAGIEGNVDRNVLLKDFCF